MKKTWQFEALDSLFFRGARSFNLNETGFLDSQFPPTAQTMAGVIRSAIAESMGVDWSKFRNGEQADIAAVIGKDTDSPGKLTFAGPYIAKDGKRLYPVPLHMLYSESKKAWSRLQPGNAMKTDMGEKCLPEAVKGKDGKPLVEGAKPLENAWLDADNMQKVLQGGLPDAFIKESELFQHEMRTGIARDNQKRKTEEGALFFTRHIRLKDGVSLNMDVDGADTITPASMLRLGGEGRMSRVQVSDAAASCLKGSDGTKKRAIVILLTHGDFNGNAGPDWEALGLTCVSACIGKAVREGGWDYKQGKPKPLKSLVPAGSVYFVQGDVSGLTHIGNRTEFGYGEIAIGDWEEKQ